MPAATSTSLPEKADSKPSPSKYTHYNKFRRKPESDWKTVISGVFDDVCGEITNKVTNPTQRKLKLKIIGGFICCGVLVGHTYSAYRGFTRLSLYGRHLLVGGGLGTLSAFPVLTFLNLKHKQYPDAYLMIRGGLWGSVCGLAHRGSYSYALPYGLIGVAIHGIMLLFWYELIKPIYYYHMLGWPDYYPPKWWPSQPMTGLEIYLNALQNERLNVTYPEDLRYFQQLDQKKEEKLQALKQQEFEEAFVYESEIAEKQQLDHDRLKPKNMFHI